MSEVMAYDRARNSTDKPVKSLLFIYTHHPVVHLFPYHYVFHIVTVSVSAHHPGGHVIKCLIVQPKVAKNSKRGLGNINPLIHFALKNRFDLSVVKWGGCGLMRG